MEQQTFYIGLGSSLGDRAATLMSALKLLAGLQGVTVRHISQFRQTQPVGGPKDQPAYMNAAAEISTTLGPDGLLAALHDIENALGRNRKAEKRWGPRTCDLDILLMGEVSLETRALTIPHPRMHEREFVLRPLAEIAPGAVHPVFGKTVSELLGELEGRNGE